MYMEPSGRSGDSTATDDLGSAWAQVAAVATAVDASLGKWLTEHHGIGLTEYRAVLQLAASPERELRINVLADRLGLNQSSVTRLVGRMEAKRLAVRDTCPDDARGVYAVITEHGSGVVESVRRPYEDKLRELLRAAADDDPQLDTAGLRRSFDAVGSLVAGRTSD